MPAHKDRQLVVSRMYPDTLRMLDKLCVLQSKKSGRPVGRSAVINQLVEDAYQASRPKRKTTA